MSEEASATILAPLASVEADAESEVAECHPAQASLGTHALVMTTEWGPTFCLVPSGFPVCPRCELGETFGDDISAVWIAPWDALTAARWYRSALEAAGYATVSMTSSSDEGSPMFIIESSLPRSDCKVQTAVGGGDDTTDGAGHPFSYVGVRYGTGCPPP